MYIHKSKDGYTVSMMALPFGGQDESGRHYFADHNHAKNFLRYLFSQSGAHRANDHTRRNLICEYDGPRIISARLNEDPQGLREDFAHRHFPKLRADKVLCDDGAYALFAVRLPSGRALSNVFHTQGSEIIADHPLIEEVGEPAIQAMVADFLQDRQGSIEQFDEATMDDDISFVDRIVQQMLTRMMGGNVVMSVSHRDQKDHNDLYHVHRLIRR